MSGNPEFKEMESHRCGKDVKYFNFLFWILSLIQQILMAYQLLDSLMVLGTAINKRQDSHSKELTVSRETATKGKVCEHVEHGARGGEARQMGPFPP